MNKSNIYKNIVLRKIKFNFKILQSRTVRILIKLRFKYFNLLSNPVGNAKNNNKDVQVILDPVNKGWVIEKIAKNLILRKSSNLTLDLFYIPRRGYRITHWMHYLNVSRDFIKTDKGIHTFLVPHIDSIQKEQEFLSNINTGAFPIFLSREHAERTSKRLKLDLIPHYISPGSDLAEEKLRFRVVISSHIYPDGRKKEHLLIQLAQEISLKNFHFIFIGKSWSKVEESVRKSGATVEWFNPNNSPFPNYKQSIDIIRGCDVFLYLGDDEGSLGALDAYLLGITLLVSNQGFHREFADRNNVYLFDDYNGLKTKLMELSSSLATINSNKWTWYNMVTKYLEYWDSLEIRKRMNK
jgi:hypothetical protein